LIEIGGFLEAALDFLPALAGATHNPLILIDFLIVELREQQFWASPIMDEIARSRR